MIYPNKLLYKPLHHQTVRSDVIDSICMFIQDAVDHGKKNLSASYNPRWNTKKTELYLLLESLTPAERTLLSLYLYRLQFSYIYYHDSLQITFTVSWD